VPALQDAGDRYHRLLNHCRRRLSAPPAAIPIISAPSGNQIHR
jgi:hypothetical protein